jgi:hypothetical protein
VLHIIAQSRRHAIRWCRQNGHDPKDVRAITRPEQLWGLSGVRVIVVDRGACLGTTEQALDLAYQMEKRGQITLRIVFTGDDRIARAASMPG